MNVLYIDDGSAHCPVLSYEVESIVFNHQNGTSHYCPETTQKQITPKLVTITLAPQISSPESNK